MSHAGRRAALCRKSSIRLEKKDSRHERRGSIPMVKEKESDIPEDRQFVTEPSQLKKWDRAHRKEKSRGSRFYTLIKYPLWKTIAVRNACLRRDFLGRGSLNRVDEKEGGYRPRSIVRRGQ